MRILVTNDDGVNAPGILALAQSLQELGEVMVIAPEGQQSAVGHGIPLHKPLRLDEVDLGDGLTAYSCSGTPADCMILGTLGEMPPPDLVVSGINAGANLGEEVLYSGTVSAALEAALHGFPAMAISVAEYDEPMYEAAACFASQAARALLSSPLNADTVLNVNVPSLPPDKIQGVVATRLGRRKYSEVVLRRDDPRGRPYYWFTGSPIEFDAAPGTDIWAVKQGMISLTMVHFDLTSKQKWEGFAQLQSDCGLPGADSPLCDANRG